jgi:hypothetical protein
MHRLDAPIARMVTTTRKMNVHSGLLKEEVGHHLEVSTKPEVKPEVARGKGIGLVGFKVQNARFCLE